MTITAYLLFQFFVVLAAFSQNLTGFAFGLILLGLVGAFGVLPITDAANVASVLSLANAWVFCRHNRIKLHWDLLRPMLESSSVGVVAGVILLTWLGANMVSTLSLLLGVAIIGCSILLLVHKTPRTTPSGKASTYFFGGIAGVLGGLFSTSGPPIVYHLYRQPLDRMVVRQCLMLMFAANALLRLILVVGSGNFSWNSLWLALTAVPAVAAVSWLQAKYPPPLSRRMVEWMVCALLLLSGASLIVSAL